MKQNHTLYKSISWKFEHLKKDQLSMVKEWLNQDYVSEFWYGEGLQNTLESLSSFVNNEETLFSHWVAYDGNIPFGYLLTSKVIFPTDHLYAKYLSPQSNAITLDLLIGNPSYLGKGLCPRMIQQFLLQEFQSVTDVFIDPQAHNSKAIHVYEKAGFKQLEEFIPDWNTSQPCILMHLKMKLLEKVVFIGTCGSGKTTVGQLLSKKLNIPCTDMDELYWLPGWQKRPFDEFQQLVGQTTKQEKWILCGNYSKLQHLTLAKCDTVVWLDLPLYVLLWRIMKRSITQHNTQIPICNGNHQSLSQFWWLLKHLFKSYWKKKRRYQKLREESTAQWIHLKSTAAVNDWLNQ